MSLPPLPTRPPGASFEPTPMHDATVRDTGFDPRTSQHLPTRRGAGGRFEANPNHTKEQS